jgi:two-component system response regulator YesN
MFTLAIIDDEFIIRNGLANNVDWNSMGFKVVFTAANGEEALQLMDKELPDVVITDIKMPVMDGIELIKNIRLRHLKTKIIILSGYNEFEYAQKGIEYGVYSYILKPVKEDKVYNLFGKVYHSLLYKDIDCEAEVDIYQSKRVNSIVNKIKDYINTNYHEKISLEELANIFFMNPTYLSKLFKDQTGDNITSYILETRIKKSKELLKGTEYQINEIAAKVGYPDYRYFCTIFKKATGITPLQYRMKNIM